MSLIANVSTNKLMESLEENIRNFLSRDNWATSSTLDDLKTVFHYDAFYCSENMTINESINTRLLEFAKIFISGEEGEYDQYKTKLKSYDFSSTCGLVWTTNYFAYRCRTCSLSPSMSLCSTCFNNGNHVGHDFNKFKSQAGGACDCGNSNVMKEIGYCKHHGPSKLYQQREPPKSLIMRLELIMPLYLRCILYSCWSLIKNIDMDDSSFNMTTGGGGPPNNTSDVLITPLSFINDLLSCGWVVQKLLARIMIDEFEFNNFINDVKDTDQYYIYNAALRSDPSFSFPKEKIQSQALNHNSLVDGFLFVCVKLRFPENLITFLIGLLTVETYKEKFVHSFLNHYSRMASTILIHAKSARSGQDYSYNMNNRIVHISVQLFSGESIALKMVKERQLHYLIVHCLLNMFQTALTRLDSKDNYVINCETPMIQNNVFWPLISDLTNLVTHKSVVNHFISDIEFMKDWTKLLKIMQFMNFFVLKEGSHIEYETMAFFHAYTMEIEISSTSMWNIWYHYRNKDDRENTLKLVRIFVSSLSHYLKSLGKFRTSVTAHPNRPPLSFHLPLMRNVTCFLSLGLVYHNIPLDSLLDTIGLMEIKRWFKETTNTLLGCHEVLIGYWVRNGQSVRTSTTYYIHSQFCYALIDMDIFAAQVCASKIPGRQVIYVLADPGLLLKGIDFNYKCLAHTDYLSQATSSINPGDPNATLSKSSTLIKPNLPTAVANIPHIISTVTNPGSTAVVSASTTVTGRFTSYSTITQQQQQQRSNVEKIQMEKQPLALESWLINLCWVLDLRNEMSTDDRAKLRKEVCCELCTEPVKRSDLSHRLPEKTGIHIQISPDVDTILKEVANYKAPTFDEYSGNLQSGLYAFKPELWDTDYDPLFQSLRSVTKRDAADALSKYREFYRQKHNIANANSLWPPYRIPPAPHPELKNLENLLHCRDLTYMMFCCLNMFINNDPVVNEDSLALVIHIILRSLEIPQLETAIDDGILTRFPNNPFTINDAGYNLRCKVNLYESFADINTDVHVYDNRGYRMDTDEELSELLEEQIMDSTERKYPRDSFKNPVQQESILTLLLKVHSKVHSLRLQSGGKSILSSQPTNKYNSKCLKVLNPHQTATKLTNLSSFTPNTSNVNPEVANRFAQSSKTTEEPMEINESPSPPTMNISSNNELNQTNNQANEIQDFSASNQTNEYIDVNSLAYFFDYPLVYNYSEDNLIKSKKTGVGINWGDGVDFVGHLLDVIGSKNDVNSLTLFQVISLIQERTQENVVASDQLSNVENPAGNNLSDNINKASEDQSMKTQSAMVLETIQEKKLKAVERRKRVIATMAKKQKDFAQTHKIDMTNPELTAKEIEEQMYECVICQTKSNPMKEKMVLLGLLCSAEGLKFMYNNEVSDSKITALIRRSYSHNLKFNLPVLSHGMIIQTCGHVVHQDCFDKYKAQRPAVTRMRRTITCPLCRRDVHHLTPITGVQPDKLPRRPSIITDITGSSTSTPPTGISAGAAAAASPSTITVMSPTGATDPVTLSLLDSLKQILFSIYQKPSNTFVSNIIEESIAKNQASLMLMSNQSCGLLRSQIELEVVICLTYPDQYSTIIKRCNFPEFIAYNRTINQNSSLVICQSDLLLGTNFTDQLPNEERNCELMTVYFLLQSPSDVLLNFIPYIWPYEDWFTIILKSTLLFAYIKCLISICAKIDSVAYTNWSLPINNEDDGFSCHLKLVLQKCKPIIEWKQQTNTAYITLDQSTQRQQQIHKPAAPLKADRTTISPIKDAGDQLVNYLLPTLRIAAVLKLRMMCVTRIPIDFPIQPLSENQDKYKEFESLCVYLDLIQSISNKAPISSSFSPNHVLMEKIQLLIGRCLSITLYPDFENVVNKLITSGFLEVYINQQKNENGKNLEILNIGNELMPPRLILLPDSYDDLFNTYHSRKCTKNTKHASAHNFPENGLCLICGQLICMICDSMPQAFSEHVGSCCYGVGLLIDINTSIIHVLLNNEISQWGSVYLDNYGEEDLELKRGRPLFINPCRLKLLEQQWLSHSFKHVVKTWRRIS